MKKKDVIIHLKKVLNFIEKEKANVNEDFRVYVHINRQISETDIEIGGTNYKTI